jgi:hypothetical protein
MRRHSDTWLLVVNGMAIKRLERAYIESTVEGCGGLGRGLRAMYSNSQPHTHAWKEDSMTLDLDTLGTFIDVVKYFSLFFIGAGVLDWVNGRITK